MNCELSLKLLRKRCVSGRHILFRLIVLITLLSCNDGGDEPTPGSELLVDEFGLWTDLGMLTSENPDAPVEDAATVKWIKENSIPIRSLTSEVFHDLQFLKEIIENKRIIQLGESSHGVKQYSQLKTRLVKFLHQEMGYNVIAFESSLFACFETHKRLQRNDISAVDAMKNGILDIWHSRSALDLFQYVQETQSMENPLILAGFDVQLFNQYGAEVRSEFLFDLISVVDSSYAATIREFDYSYAITRNKLDNDFFNYIDQEQDTITEVYNQLSKYFKTNKELIQQKYSGSNIDIEVAIQIAYSIPLDIAQLSLFFTDVVSSFDIRDQGMSENVLSLALHQYPTEKIMIWAHNFHIKYDLPAVEQSTQFNGTTGMGTWLKQAFDDQLYTIGLFMYRGEAATNDRITYPIQPHTQGSMESILYSARKKVVFLELSQPVEEDGNQWIFNSTRALSWGANPMQLIIKNNYDGILFIDTVTPPRYL